MIFFPRKQTTECFESVSSPPGDVIFDDTNFGMIFLMIQMIIPKNMKKTLITDNEIIGFAKLVELDHDFIQILS